MKSYLGREIRALGLSTKLQEKFLDFAIQHGGADRRKFPPRLYHVLKGRTPSAFFVTLLVRFFKERRYEDFVRVVKSHVEYITSSGDTSELEQFVAAHPLMLRIVGVRMTDWVVTGKPDSVDVHLRSPIDPIDESEADKIDQTTGLDGFNQRFFEFTHWLSSQGPVPMCLELKTGQKVEVRYQPDWLRSGEDDFEWSSDLSGSVDISEGVKLLVYSGLGADSPNVPSGLDTFYHLFELFCGTEAKPAPKELSFAEYWPRVVSRESDIAEVFFTHLDQFPTEVRSVLEPFFNSFASRHRAWVQKAIKDNRLLDEKDDDYVPRPEDVFHYNRVKQVFFEELEPVLRLCWDGFARTALSILETERGRARAHFQKLTKIKDRLE